MRIHYGGEKGPLEGEERSGESLPSAKLRRQGKRVVVRSSGAGHTGVHVRMPEENFTDLSGTNQNVGGCSVCQMARMTSPNAETLPEKERLPFGGAEVVTGTEPGFCVLRLPVKEARFLGKLLLEAAQDAEQKSRAQTPEQQEMSDAGKEEPEATEENESL